MSGFFTSLLCLFISNLIYAQCDVTEKVLPDGTMYYHAETLLFYKTREFQLSGNIVTDKEHYFLSLKPVPYPDKSKNIKLKTDLTILLNNDIAYTLKVFDTYYNNKDTSFTALYIFDSKDLAEFRKLDVKNVILDLGDGPKTYTFRLHTEALRVQLDCFSKPRKEKI